jgi:hypothetical protein
MLGTLRPAIERRRSRTSPLDVQALDKDLSRLASPALHDALAEAALVPPRGRLPTPGESGLGPGPSGGGQVGVRVTPAPARGRA